MNPGRRGLRVERGHDRVAEVREPEDAAPVVDRADRQRAPRLDGVDEPRDVAARARADHERQPKHDRGGRRSPAGIRKRDAESALADACRGSSTAAIVLRLPLVVGPGARGNLGRLVDAIAAVDDPLHASASANSASRLLRP